MFTLFICQSYFLAVCTTIVTAEYPTEEACYRAEKFVLDNAPNKPATVLCIPKEQK